MPELPTTGNQLAAVVSATRGRNRAEYALAVASRHALRRSREKRHVADQVGPSELRPRVGLVVILAVGRAVVAPDDPQCRSRLPLPQRNQRPTTHRLNQRPWKTPGSIFRSWARRASTGRSWSWRAPFARHSRNQCDPAACNEGHYSEDGTEHATEPEWINIPCRPKRMVDTQNVSNERGSRESSQ